MEQRDLTDRLVATFYATDALRELATFAHDTSKANGFHENPVPVSEFVANLHAEASELWEAYRENRLHEPCDKAERMQELGLASLTCLEEELADLVLRTLDFAQSQGVNIGKAVAVKDAYNSTRGYRHGGKKA
jgi:NTP pyrophosphatase (non-canonical NTP hydrolase)